MPNPTSQTILIVDDDEMIVQICEALLKDTGYTVLTAPNGVGVTRLLNHSHVDLLLVDIFMPEVDGFAVIQKVRERAPSIVIIAMSGGVTEFAPTDVLHLCARIGAHAVLAKPFTAAQLMETITAALQTSSA